MKYTIFIIALIISMFSSISTLAVCHLSKLENTTACTSDSLGECCLIEYTQEDEQCAEVWCHGYEQCSWQKILSLCE